MPDNRSNAATTHSAALANRYGRFIDGGAAFEITDPRTPMPWVNVLCNGRYGLIVSQNGGGFSWLDHCQLNVLTRWEMDLARDDHGRFVLLSDLDTGDVWSATPQPCRTAFDSYRCVHRPGSTSFVTEAHGVRTAWTLAAAEFDACEIWTVRVTNVSGRRRRLRACAFFEWCCGTAPDVKREFHRLFFTTAFDEARSAITATKNMWEAPFGDHLDHWNRPWPHAAAFAVGGLAAGEVRAMADKSSFLGRYGTPAAPAAMTARDWPNAAATFGRFGDASSALGGDVTLEPGQSRDLAFVLAVADTPENAAILADEHRDPKAAAAEIAAAEARWAELLGASTVQTEAADFDTLNNTWLRYQAISGRLWGRTGYYQQSGAFGFRDQLQDSQVWLPIDPERTAEQIMLHAAHQFADGTVYHWWNPITETGNHTACSDDYLWLPFVTIAYLQETGDFGILQRTAPFVDDKAPATLLDHCRRAIELSLKRQSPRGLPYIGDMDWNDGLSALGPTGESIWLAHFFAWILKDWAHVERTAGDASRIARLDERRVALVEALNEHGWDGQWFRRATDSTGRWLGASSSEAGRIFLNAQTWAILAGTTTPERQASAWKAAKEHLLTDYGPLLLAPAYTEPDPKVGYITRYAPGARENGGVYMHAATWALLAACRVKDRAAATQIWRSISPPTRCAADADRYWAEPYVLPGNVDGPLSDKPGRAGWTWYTGSAAWLNRVALDGVLGLRATWEGLTIDPCPPAELGVVEASRRWRGRTVRVRFDARSFDADARPALVVDGRAWEGNTLREEDLAPGSDITVEVRWGAGVRTDAPLVEPKGASAGGIERKHA